jgi:hypothetical protein
MGSWPTIARAPARASFRRISGASARRGFAELAIALELGEAGVTAQTTLR